MSLATLSRLEREGVQRREAKRCAEEGAHLFARLYWQPGDYSTPDRFVCGRCFKTLRSRPHGMPAAAAPNRPFALYDRKVHDAPPPAVR